MLGAALRAGAAAATVPDKPAGDAGDAVDAVNADEADVADEDDDSDDTAEAACAGSLVGLRAMGTLLFRSGSGRPSMNAAASRRVAPRYFPRACGAMFGLTV